MRTPLTLVVLLISSEPPEDLWCRPRTGPLDVKWALNIVINSLGKSGGGLMKSYHLILIAERV